MWTTLAVAAGLLCGAAGYWWIARLFRRWLWARRRERGRRGELDAAALLRGEGYQILEEQHRGEVEMEVDGRPHPYTVRPDYLVRRDGRTFVAEVKTGRRAPDPLYSPTRRQLLEYRVCFPNLGLLLVDMEARRIFRVDWSELQGLARSRPRALARGWILLLVLLAFALGVGLGAFFSSS